MPLFNARRKMTSSGL